MEVIKRLTVAQWANYISVVSLLLMVAWFGFFEKPWLQYGNLPFPVVNANVKPNDVVRLKVSRCSSASDDRAYSLTHALVSVDSGEKVLLPAITSGAQVSPGCTTVISAVNVIPDKTVPGVYYVEGVATIEGFVRPHYVKWRSAQFNVVSP